MNKTIIILKEKKCKAFLTSNKLKVIWIIIGLLLIGNASAEDYLRGAIIDLKVPCIDANYLPCNSATKCNATILYPSGEILLSQGVMTRNPTYYNYTIDNIYTQSTGMYKANINCYGANNGFTTFNFNIKSVEDLSLSTGIMYLVLILIFLAVSIIMIIGAWNMDTKNKYDLGGKLVQVNFNKHIKTFLFFASYLCMTITFLLCEVVADSFLTITFIGDMFHILFLVGIIGLFPTFILLLVFSFMKYLVDFQQQKLAKRGLKQR